MQIRSIPLRNRLTGHRTNDRIHTTQFLTQVDLVCGCVLTDTLTSAPCVWPHGNGLTSPSARRLSLLEYIYTHEADGFTPTLCMAMVPQLCVSAQKNAVSGTCHWRSVNWRCANGMTERSNSRSDEQPNGWPPSDHPAHRGLGWGSSALALGVILADPLATRLMFALEPSPVLPRDAAPSRCAATR